MELEVLTDAELEQVAGAFGVSIITRYVIEGFADRALNQIWSAKWGGPIGQMSGVVDAP